MREASLDPDLLSLSFDVYQRYKLVSEVVSRVRRTEAPQRILDAGGAGGPLPRFLPRDRVYVLDQAVAPFRVPCVVGDVTRLPFADAAFDLTVSIDVYEHIPPDGRRTYLEELARVSGAGVVVAGPFRSAGVEQAERTADECHRLLYGRPHRWLEEHIANGLPDLAELRRFLEEHGLHTAALPNGYLPRWSMLILAQMMGDSDLAERRVYDSICRLYNRHFYDDDNREPCYRYVVVATGDPALVARLPSLVHRPPEAAEQLLADVAALTLPLAAGARQRTAERDRLRDELAALQQGLAALHASRTWRLITRARGIVKALAAAGGWFRRKAR
jgi:hypothetical protein